MLSIPITDFVAQTVAYVMHRNIPPYSILSFLSCPQPIELTPRYALMPVPLTKYQTQTAYAAVTLHLPSDFALLFDVNSLSKRKPSDLEKHIVREPLALNPLAGFSSLFPFVVIIIPHFQYNVNSFFDVFRKICAFLTKERNQHIFLVFLL